MIPKASSFQNGDKGYSIFEKRTFLKSGPFCPGNRAIFYFNLTMVLSSQFPNFTDPNTSNRVRINKRILKGNC